MTGTLTNVIALSVFGIEASPPRPQNTPTAHF